MHSSSDQKERPSEEGAADKEQLLSCPEVRPNGKHT